MQVSNLDLKLSFGCQVSGISLSEDVKSDDIDMIKKCLSDHKLVLFRNHQTLTEDRQIQISRWFGDLETAGFECHTKSESDFVLRVSNDPAEGLQNFGTSGFHIDCSFLPNPSSMSVYHMIQASKDGDTEFVDLSSVIDSLCEARRQKWQQLDMVKTYKYIARKTDKPGYVVHPLVFRHPYSGQPSLCIHQGHTSCYIWNRGTKEERKTKKEETAEILGEIEEELQKQAHYRHKWQSGDVLLSDNLALAHWAPPGTQTDPQIAGTRIMHRTLVKGEHALIPWT